MVASEYGYINIVQLLLEHGADVNLQDEVSSSANIACVFALLLCTWHTAVVKCVMSHVCLSMSAWH